MLDQNQIIASVVFLLLFLHEFVFCNAEFPRKEFPKKAKFLKFNEKIAFEKTLFVKTRSVFTDDKRIDFYQQVSGQKLIFFISENYREFL